MKRSLQEQGQILTEFVYTCAMFLAIAAILLIFLAVFSEYGWRISALIAWEPWAP